jgi:gliding motility-associated protein GldC
MDKNKITRTSAIQLNVGLNEEKRPVTIEWLSQDGPTSGKPQHCKAFLLSLFDQETQDTLKIDLWTEQMEVREMDRFFFQSLKAMADTYVRATQNRELASDLQRFAQYFGEQTGILKKSN